MKWIFFFPRIVTPKPGSGGDNYYISACFNELLLIRSYILLFLSCAIKQSKLKIEARNNWDPSLFQETCHDDCFCDLSLNKH